MAKRTTKLPLSDKCLVHMPSVGKVSNSYSFHTFPMHFIACSTWHGISNCGTADITQQMLANFHSAKPLFHIDSVEFLEITYSA